MRPNLVGWKAGMAVLLLAAASGYGQTRRDSPDIRTLIRQGHASLARNRLREAAVSFQKAVDLNPSSAEAHEGLGVALFREMMVGNVRPSNDTDMARRAENHLSQACDLSPSSPRPLIQFSQLEAALAEREADVNERSGRYKKAQDLLKRAIDLKPGEAELYLALANVERDEFGPVLQQAKARAGKNAGPILDSNLRQTLQQQYGVVVNDAIANAQRASELNGNSAKPLLLLSKLLQERALIRDTPEQYSADMTSASQWRLQFLSVGGHPGEESGVKQ